METSSRKRAVTVGIFVFLGLTLLVVGVLTIGNMKKAFSRSITVQSVFDDVNGLQPGNNIWFSGVKIGTVKKIRFYGDSQVEVTMNIEAKSQEYIRKDAKAKISSDGLIGSKIIVIYGGTTKVPSIEDGDHLAVERIFTTEDMMNTLQDNNVNLLAITSDFKEISKKIRNGEGSLGKVLNDDNLYLELEKTLISLKKTASNAQNLTASFAAYGEKLHQQGGLANDLATDTLIMKDLRATMVQLNRTMGTAHAMMEDLKETSADLKTNKTSPIGVLMHDEAAAASLKSTLRNLETSSVKLDENLEALQHNFLLRRFFKKKAKEEAKAAKDSLKRIDE